MAKFYYKAKNWQGEVKNGELEVATRQKAMEELFKMDYTILCLQQKSMWQEWWQILRRYRFKKQVSSRDHMIFCRQFGAMLGAGFTVLKALYVICNQVENELLGEKLHEVAMEVEKGSSLSVSLSAYPQFFPPLMVGMIAAGETGGILPRVLEQLGVHYERQSDTEEKIRSAMVYPVVVSIVALLVLGVMVFFILPTFGSMFQSMGVELPGITLVVMALGQGLIDYWYLLAFILAGGAIIFSRLAKTEKGQQWIQQLKMKLPLFKTIYIKMKVYHLARNMSSLLRSGVNILGTLELLRGMVNNRFYAAALENAAEEISKGRSMAASFKNSELFPDMMTEMIQVGEETGNLEEMLNHAADYYEKEVTYIVDRLRQTLEPAILLTVGLIVGVLVASLVIPMFQMYERF